MLKITCSLLGWDMDGSTSHPLRYTEQKSAFLLHGGLVSSGIVGKPCASPAPQSNSEYYKMWAGESLAQKRDNTRAWQEWTFQLEPSFPQQNEKCSYQLSAPQKFSKRTRSTISSLTHKLRAILSWMSNRLHLSTLFTTHAFVAVHMLAFWLRNIFTLQHWPKQWHF